MPSAQADAADNIDLLRIIQVGSLTPVMGAFNVSVVALWPTWRHLLARLQGTPNPCP